MALGVKYATKAVATATTDDALNGTGSTTPAAITGFRVLVLGVVVVQGTAAGTITFNSKGGGGGTAITAAFSPGASTTMSLPYNPAGWFQTNSGEALTVTTGTTTTAAAIHVVYQYVVA
jgi:hypothetical protein